MATLHAVTISCFLPFHLFAFSFSFPFYDFYICFLFIPRNADSRGSTLSLSLMHALPLIHSHIHIRASVQSIVPFLFYAISFLHLIVFSFCFFPYYLVLITILSKMPPTHLRLKEKRKGRSCIRIFNKKLILLS